MRFHRTPLMMLAVCSLLLPASIATAQESSDEGVVQLGHRARARRAARLADSPCLSCDNCDSCDGCGDGSGYGCGYGNGNGKGWGRNSRDGSRFGSRFASRFDPRGGMYGNGNCPNGSCRHSMAASHFGGRYGYGGNPHYSSCGIGHLLNKHSPYHVCTYSPDHGYAPPAERPIWPHSAEYSRMFPAGWTGEGSVADPSFRHPMVYMPTDTTQLGYYYQHVPRWRSQPGMLAPVPNPVEFHNPDLGFDYRSGYHNAVVNGGQGCPPGSLSSDDHHSEGISVDSPPVEQSPAAAKPVSMHEGNAAKSDEPVKPQMVPPAEDASPMPPATPTQTKSPGPAPRPGAELGRSAASPQLIPVPAR